MANAHIVVANVNSDQVLTRKAGYLADQNDWSISTRPRMDVDTNLFFPYILYSQSFPEFSKTRLAAYFTHHDITHEIKDEWWQLAAGKMDIRFTTSYVGELAGYGETIHCRTPVDPQFIVPTCPFPEDDEFIFCVSGVSYADCRKGEDLLEKLLKSRHMIGAQLIGSGREWPFACRWYPWSDMATFYRSMHILLCTSQIEGVPMPPLEALAMGIPVIVPRGVGMMDELPDISGIWRFKPNSFRSLGYAIKRARAEFVKVDRKALVNSVSDYTVENWANDFAARLNPSPVTLESKLVTVLSTADTEARVPAHNIRRARGNGWRKHAGMYCVAFGKPARKCAELPVSNSTHWRPSDKQLTT